MTEQLVFELPSAAALGRGDFFVSPANAAAVEALQSWHDWPQGKLLLVGAAGAGKTHLAHIWANMVEAKIISAAEIGDDVDRLARGPIVVEDAHEIAGDPAAELAFFHLHNLVLAERHPLLITARRPASRWELGLPDLKSRMQGTGLVSLAAPDDTLLVAVLVKLFADRQITLEANVLDYIVTRMERSFAGAGRLVSALDQAALAQKRAITRPLAAQVLDKLAAGCS